MKKMLFSIKTIICLTGLLFLILNIITPLLADDYTYSFIYPTSERLKSVADIFVSQYNHYMMHGGRCVAHFIAQFFLLIGNKLVFNIFNTIIYCAFVFLICFHITGSFKNIKPSLFVTINILLWFLTPTWGQNFLWLTGSCNYLWTTTIILTFLVPYRKSNENPQYKMNLLFSFLFFILGILAGWSNENSAAAVLFLLIAFFIIKIINKKQPVLFEVLGIIGFLIGFGFLLVAPGNYIRFAESEMVQYSMFTKLVTRFISVTSVFAKNYGLLFTILSVWVGYDLIRHQRQKISLFTWFYFFAGLAGTYSMIMSPFFADRAFLIVMVFLLITFFNVLLKIEFEIPQIIKRNIPVFSVLILLFFFYSYFEAGKNIFGVYSRWQQRISYIQTQKNEGVVDIEINQSISVWNKHAAAYMIPDLYIDTEKYPNKSIANFYEINSIKGIDEND